MNNELIYWEKWEEENIKFLQNAAIWEAEQILNHEEYNREDDIRDIPGDGKGKVLQDGEKKEGVQAGTVEKKADERTAGEIRVYGFGYIPGVDI